MKKLNYEKIYFYFFVNYLESNPSILSLSNPLNLSVNLSDYGIYRYSGNLSNLQGITTFKGEMGVSYQFIDFLVHLSDELYNEICDFYKMNSSKYYVSLDVVVDTPINLSSHVWLYYIDKFTYKIDFSNHVLHHYNENDNSGLSLSNLGFNDLSNPRVPYLFNPCISHISMLDYLDCLNNGLVFTNDLLFMDVGLDVNSLKSILSSSCGCGEQYLLLYINSKCFTVEDLLSLSQYCHRSNIVLCLGICGKRYIKSLLKNKDLLESSFKHICYRERN